MTNHSKMVQTRRKKQKAAKRVASLAKAEARLRRKGVRKPAAAA